MPKAWNTVGRVGEPCFCIPGRVCRKCQAEAEENPVQESYGYNLADQDGFDGGSVSAQDHKEEEMIAAAVELFDAKIIDSAV